VKETNLLGIGSPIMARALAPAMGCISFMTASNSKGQVGAGMPSQITEHRIRLAKFRCPACEKHHAKFQTVLKHALEKGIIAWLFE